MLIGTALLYAAGLAPMAFSRGIPGGLVFDWTGSYDAGWGALIVIGLAAFTLQWLMDDRPPPVCRTKADKLAPRLICE